MAIHVDSMAWAIGLGLIFVVLFRTAAVKATAGVPGGLQNAVEMTMEFIDDLAESIFSHTNPLIAPMALTTALLPLMEGQPSARVVTVTSGAQYFGRINWDDPCSEQRYDRWQAYSQSKLANVMFALTLEERLRAQASTIRSLAAHPGLARTNLQPASIAANGSRIEAFAYRLMDPLFQSAAMGALPQLHAATAASAQGGEHYGPDGFGGLRGWPQRQPVAPAARDPSQRERLWRLSEALLQGATTPDTPHQSADLAAD